MSETRSDYTPDTRSHPGETLHDILEERPIKLGTFARGLGKPLYTAAHTLYLLLTRYEGTKIDKTVALALEDALGEPSADFWLRLQRQYDDHTHTEDT